MSVESQAILAGHVPVKRIASLLEAEVSGKILVRDMQRPQYKIIEFQTPEGSWSTLHVFLDSWAADDYASVYKGPSTFVTAEFNTQNYNLVRSLAAAIGGLVRRTEGEPWVELEPVRY